MRLLLVWVLNAVALLFVAYLMPQWIEVNTFGSALVAALVLGLLNTIVKPVLIFLTLPVTLLTLGLFLLILNALMFWAAGALLEGFHVDGFTAAFFGALLYSFVSWLLSLLLSDKDE